MSQLFQLSCGIIKSAFINDNNEFAVEMHLLSHVLTALCSSRSSFCSGRTFLILCDYSFLRADMGQFDATKGKQALEIRSSLSDRRALTDPILPGDSADLAHARSLQWAKAHGESSFFSMFFLPLCRETTPPFPPPSPRLPHSCFFCTLSQIMTHTHTHTRTSSNNRSDRHHHLFII